MWHSPCSKRRSHLQRLVDSGPAVPPAPGWTWDDEEEDEDEDEEEDEEEIAIGTSFSRTNLTSRSSRTMALS